MRTLKHLLCILIRMRRGYLIILFGLLMPALQAQHHLYSTRNYTAIDGLPQSKVTAIVEDAHGYLWLGTEGGGLARFDGQKFKVYTTKNGLLSNDIMGLKIDRQQNLWILNTWGITKFDGRTFKRFQNSGSPSTAKRFRRFYDHGDSIFAITQNGALTKIYGDSVYYWEKPLVKDRQILRLHLGPDGEKLFFMDDGSYVVQTNKLFTGFTPDVQAKVWNIFNYKGGIHLNTDKGIFRLDIKTRSLVPLDWKLDRFVLLHDEKDDFFWTSDGTSLFKESTKNGVAKIDTVLRDVEVYNVMKDSEGNSWFSSNGRGLYKYFIQDFNRCSSENLRAVMAIRRTQDGAIWIGTLSKGLWKVHKGKVKSYLQEEESSRKSIRCMNEAPDGTFWIATGWGLGKYDKEKDDFVWYGRKEGLPHNSIIAVETDEYGKLWVGTVQGISVYDGKTFRNYSTADGLSSNYIWTIHYSKRFKTTYLGSDFSIQSFKDGRAFTIPIPGLNNTGVLGIQPYQDSLLVIATGGAGVLIFNPETHSRKFISSQDGLASDFIYFAAQDDKGTLWIGTEKGINKVRLDDKLEMSENLFYGYENGLKGVETNMNAFYLSKTDKFFGLIDGLYEYNDLSQEPTKSFDLHLTDIQLFYGEYTVRDFADSLYGFFKIPHAPQLPPDKNHITFSFNRVDKRYPASVKFKYILENFDKTWSQTASVNYVTYSNLPPGEYVFRVMSTNNRGSWSDTKIAFPFTIKTPFYQTASFMTGLFILVAGLVTFILYLRVKQRVNKMLMLERIRVKEQENLRKEIARDFHDEMGNQLTRIINYVSLLKLNATTQDGSQGTNGHTNGYHGSHDLYSKVEDSAKYLYSGTRDFIWSIDPVNDELSKLFIHIRDFGEKLFEEKNIQFRAFNEVREKIKLPYGFSREANLIFKEAMTNAFKYSEAKNVSLQLKRSEDNLGFEMSLEDDGIGFSTDEISKSNGLKNLRERADRIHGLLRINSVKQSGTKITLSFKLSKTLKYGLAL
jgi:signal transduction histidine kinase/ligand-binding sensor domain-containing protein